MKTAYIFLGGTIFGAVMGALVMFLVFPFLFWGGFETLPTTVAYAPESHESNAPVTSQFREDAEGQDLIHWAKGSVSTLLLPGEGYFLELHEDFEVGPGPNYWVYLNTQPGIDNEDEFLADKERIKLAQLREFSGQQIYMVFPAQTLNKRAITIWCEAFGQYIGSADIEFVQQPD